MESERGKVSAEDEQMLPSFGRFDPPIASFPHCIFVSSAARLRIVTEVVHCKPGLFGGTAPYLRPDGTPYLPPDEGITDEFVFWEVEENQRRIYEWYFCGADNAQLLIDARTPGPLLARMHAVNSNEGSYPYESYINAVADFIEELGWAYIAMESEGEFAMFVTARRQADWVDQVREKIGPAAFSLIQDGDRWRWPPIHEDPRNRAGRLERREHGWESDPCVGKLF